MLQSLAGSSRGPRDRAERYTDSAKPRTSRVATIRPHVPSTIPARIAEQGPILTAERAAEPHHAQQKELAISKMRGNSVELVLRFSEIGRLAYSAACVVTPLNTNTRH